jgi:aryl-alcohol dehydrogenase-like predicted oxidoreductase
VTARALSLGCHNLTGGSSLLRSRRLVHCALDLGIRRFDVAPSYGLGTAERTLAGALGARRNDPEIEITTKYGIAAPRLGGLAAWLREPYRFLRSRLPQPQSGGSATIGRDRISAPAFTGTAIGAAEASLKALGVDRIGAFLSHERLSNELAERYADDMRELLRRGRVAHVGCSGEIANVTEMLAKSRGLASIAQVSVRDHGTIDGKLELRLFNLGSFARELVRAGGPGTSMLRDLADAVPRRFGLDPVGATLAGVLAWVGQQLPQAICIVNASTDARLAAVVTASAERTVADWARAFDPALTTLLQAPA